MGYADERRIVESRVATLWGSKTPIAYKDVPFNVPVGEAWIMVSIISGDAVAATIGAPGENLTRSVGVVAIQVNAPGGKGSRLARELSDDACDMFRNVIVENMRFMVPYAAESSVEGSSWVSWTVFCPFNRDDFNS